jgi:hypothetical protein
MIQNSDAKWTYQPALTGLAGGDLGGRRQEGRWGRGPAAGAIRALSSQKIDPPIGNACTLAS